MLASLIPVILAVAVVESLIVSIGVIAKGLRISPLPKLPTLRVGKGWIKFSGIVLLFLGIYFIVSYNVPGRIWKYGTEALWKSVTSIP